MKNQYYKWIYYEDEKEYSLLIPIIKNPRECLAVSYDEFTKQMGVSFNFYPISDYNENVDLEDELYSFKKPPKKIRKELEKEAVAAVFVNG